MEEEEEEGVMSSGTRLRPVAGRVCGPRAEVEEVLVSPGPALTDASAGMDWLSWSGAVSLVWRETERRT